MGLRIFVDFASGHFENRFLAISSLSINYDSGYVPEQNDTTQWESWGYFKSQITTSKVNRCKICNF